MTASAQAARGVVVSAADRQVWFPGNDPAPHLDGSMPGDYGFDPLSLGSDPKILKWYATAQCPKMGQGTLDNTYIVTTLQSLHLSRCHCFL